MPSEIPRTLQAPLATGGSGTTDLLRDLVEQLDAVVFRFDADGRWTYLSPAWSRRLGWDVAGSLGQLAAKFIERADRDQLFRNWGEMRNGRRCSYAHEVRVSVAGGGYRWMMVNARAQRGPGGELLNVTGTFTDISGLKAGLAELANARAAAETANRSKSEFLSTMSHELRTPLNAVIGLSESLLEFGPPFDPARTQRYLGIIQDSGRQLLAQINDVLDVARLEAGRITVDAESLDLRALCTTVLELAQREIRARRLVIETQFPPEPLLVRGDERLLRQVMQNLVSNAVKFTPEGGRIELTATRLSSGGGAVAIADTGIGIPADKMSLLFKPFSQVDSTLGRRFGGTGLGLLLVDRLVRLHGGQVRVTSTPGKGSTFTIELPSPVANDDDRLLVRSRVVVVENDSYRHTLLGDALRQYGLEVVICEHPDCVGQAVRAGQPSLVLVNLGLLPADDLTWIRKLRDRPGGAEHAIVAMTSLPNPMLEERCRADGADACVAVPGTAAELGPLIRRFAGVALA